MPTVSINRDNLYEKLGRKYTDKEFDELCFQFGLEVDDIVDDPEKGITLKIEVAANRYDLLCIEGIALALNVFNGKTKLPKFQLVPPKSKNEYKIIVKPATAEVRPFVVGAVLRNITFNKDVYNSFIDLQDKLHHNIARKRSLVAIGTHDLDTVSGPFTYDAEVPSQIDFTPLNRTKSIKADKLMEELLQDLHLREYVPIIKDKVRYPVIRDSNGVVLSLPPIINGDRSKITLDTKNVFIECTGTDEFRTQVVLDTMLCMFSCYCAKPFTVEPVQVVLPNGKETQFPKLPYRTEVITPRKCNIVGGVNESAESIAEYLNKMCLGAKAVPKKDEIAVEIGPLRYDVLHEVDIVDDFCVSFGFDKFAADMKMPSTYTVGQELELNYLSDKLRLLLSQNNFTEAATFTLCAKSDIGDKLRLKLEDEPYVEIGNPKTTECEALRTTLLPGLLKTISSNKHMALPIRMFEVADVVVKDNDPEQTNGVGARNIRHLCAVNYNVKAGVEHIQGLLDTVMMALKIPSDQPDLNQPGYYLEQKNSPSYFPGWGGAVMVGSVEVGQIGAVHPEVILNFNLNHPASALSLDIQKLFEYAQI